MDGKQVKEASKDIDNLSKSYEGAFQDKQGRWRTASGQFMTTSEKAKMLGKDIKEAGNNTEKFGTQTEKSGRWCKIISFVDGAGKVAAAAFKVVAQSLDAAISRFDTMQKYPKVLGALGFSAEESRNRSNNSRTASMDYRQSWTMWLLVHNNLPP